MIFALTTRDENNGIATTLHASEQGMLATLRSNYALDEEIPEHLLIDYVEEQGVQVVVSTHEIPTVEDERPGWECEACSGDSRDERACPCTKSGQHVPVEPDEG